MINKVILFIFISIFISGTLFAQDDARSPEAGQAYNAGNTLAKSRDYEGAIKKYLEAIKADDNFPNANYNLAYCYEKTGQLAKAEASYKNAIKLDNKFSNAYIALGNLQVDIEKIDEAKNTFSAVLAFDPGDSKANYGLGKVYYKQKQYKVIPSIIMPSTIWDCVIQLLNNIAMLPGLLKKLYQQ